MKITNSVITFIRGDDDDLVVALSDGSEFIPGDKAVFCLRATKSSETDIFQIISTTFVEYNDIQDGGILISIPHDTTIDIPLGTYYYTIWIEWSDGTFVTVVPPTKFVMSAGGSH